jgi:hypothetical protein
VIGIEDDLGQGRVDPVEVASILGGALDGGARQRAPWWASLGLVAGVIALVGALHHRLSRWRLALALLALLGGLVLFQLVLSAYVSASLLPLGRVLFAALVAFAGLWALDEVARRRSIERAREMTERAAMFHARGLAPMGDHEFFSKVGDLALQAHSADFVLVAELPARQWHLKFWTHRGSGESLVKEVRRDIRRTPYSDVSGVASVRVVDGFLVLKDTPVLVVPLQALGEIEGYVFLCGERAKTAFNADRSAADQLATDLGLLLRARRVSSSQQESIVDSLAVRSAGGAAAAARLALAAEGAFEGVELFSMILREAPTPLLYADSFADVRIISHQMADWLRRLAVPLPTTGADSPLPQGLLSLQSVLGALTGEGEESAARLLAQMLGRTEPLTTLTGPEGFRCKLSMRAVRRHEDGLGAVRGYVLSLVPQSSLESSSAPESMQRLTAAAAMPPSLVVFPVAEMIKKVVADASADSGASIRILALPVTFALGPRTVLRRALSRFLAEVSAFSPAGSAPTVSVAERDRVIEVSLMGLHLGLPHDSIRQFVESPQLAPPELASLARLIDVIVQSQGSVRLSEASGWGIDLSVTLLRATVDTKVPPPPLSYRPDGPPSMRDVAPFRGDGPPSSDRTDSPSLRETSPRGGRASSG